MIKGNKVHFFLIDLHLGWSVWVLELVSGAYSTSDVDLALVSISNP
jgi:hypothetical protein